MAQFLPFRGLRYNCERVELSNVICPPYDVIKGAARDELLGRDPHNIVAIELAARYGEKASSEQYERCAQLLQQWQDEGILQRDDPAFYVYEQEFSLPESGETRRRRGVMGALTLEPFGAGVQPHEHTLSGPKADRLNLLRATRANISPIFGLVGDDDGWINGLIEDIVFDEPHCKATDADGVTHRLWVVRDDETVNGLVAAFDNESVLIADGHHRYETALNFWSESGEGAGSESSVMMLCVSTKDPGLVVLPTHRLIKNVDSERIAMLPEKLQRFFEVEKVDELPIPGDDAPRPQLGLVTSEGRFRLSLRDESYLSAMDTERSEAYNALDVSVLHRLILENELGVDAQKLAAGEHVSYTIHAEEAARAVESGEAVAAFLLRGTPVAQTRAVASAGDKMPQKSTYFYPKLYTGLVLRPLD